MKFNLTVSYLVQYLSFLGGLFESLMGLDIGTYGTGDLIQTLNGKETKFISSLF